LIHRVIAFYLDSRGDLDAYIAHCEQQLDNQSATGKRLNVKQLRERFAQLPGAPAKAS
jgi:hypothetical protein